MPVLTLVLALYASTAKFIGDLRCNGLTEMLRVGLFPSPYSEGISLASRQTISCAIKFSSEISFKPVILGRRNVIFELFSYYFKMIKWWLKADVVITIYPYICINLRRNYFVRKLESALISWLNKGKYSILYIVDLPIEQTTMATKRTYKKAYEIEARIFKSFDVLLVFNENMKKRLQEKYGLEDSRFVLFEILDYESDYVYSGQKKIQKPIKIAFLASSLSRRRFSWIKNLPFSDGVMYSFFGNDGEWLRELGRNDIEYKGTIPPKEAPRILSQQYHFGLINYDDPIEEYLQYGSTSKFSAYIAAGLPVLCPKKISYLYFLIQKYGVGLHFDSLADIPKLIMKLRREEYDLMRANCLQLSKKVRGGYFFKKSVNAALQKLGKHSSK